MDIRTGFVALTLSVALAWPIPAAAVSFTFSTGSPDGRLATASGLVGVHETETADDFILSQRTLITGATFTGLIPLGLPLSAISNVEVEVYRIFPLDSGPFSGNVPTRTNSPSDVDFASRDGLAGELSFSASLLNPSFTAANSVVSGIAVGTGGEGPRTGQEVLISVLFNPAIDLLPDHYFFRPEALLSSGSFLWLSAPKPITGGTGPFAPDLQTWIRNDTIAPDWLRVGTDIVGGTTFNAAFSLSGDVIPEPATLWLLSSGLLGLAVAGSRRRK